MPEKKSHGFYKTPLLKILNGLRWPLPPFCLLKNRRRHVVSVISSGSIILLEITLDKNLKINFRKPRPFKFCGFFKKIEYKNFSTFLYSIFFSPSYCQNKKHRYCQKYQQKQCFTMEKGHLLPYCHYCQQFFEAFIYIYYNYTFIYFYF